MTQPRALSLATLASLALALTPPAAAGDEHDAHGHDHAASHDGASAASRPHDDALSPGLRQLLIEEMIAIQGAMQSIVPALAAGEWHQVHELGQKIHDSFVLTLRLTDAQRRELHTKLPPGFLELDREFHNNARRLGEAAHRRDAAVAQMYFYKLNEGCTTCHARHAAERFPGLAAASTRPAHEH